MANRDAFSTSVKRVLAACLSALFLLTSSGSALAADIDLSSTTAASAPTVSASGRPLPSVNIRVGDGIQTFRPGQSMTAAQEAAVNQVLHSGRQQIIIGSDGRAVGGSLNLSTDLNTRASSGLGSLVIPSGVTAIRDFATSGVLSLTGNLINSGSLYAFSSNAVTTTAVMNAANVLNLQGALISTVLPGRMTGALTALSSLNLQINATNNVSNLGTIISSGNLTITAGGAVANGPSPIPVGAQLAPAGTSSTALIQAARTLTFNTNNLFNSGTLSALNGNINVQALKPGDLKIDSSGGALEAHHGDINISNTISDCTASIRLIGGDYLSSQLNVNAGQSWLRGQLGQVSGIVNIAAGNASFGAATEKLEFGKMDVTGDPTYFNTSGSLVLNGGVPATNGFDLALIASGDVIVGSGTLDTTNPNGGNAGNLIVIAGASVTGGTTSGSSGDTTTTLTLTQSGLTTHGSATGGAIKLTGITGINTNGTIFFDSNSSANDVSDGNGGKVTLVAFSGNGSAGNGLTPGTINLGSSAAINTFGAGLGSNGNVLVIAGATTDPAGSSAINIPAIYTGANSNYSQIGTGGGGSVTIITATPTISNGSITILNGTQGGTGVLAAGTTQNTSIGIGEISGNSFSVSSSVTNWQAAARVYALNVINAFRAANGVGPLQSSPMLDSIATNYAAYEASTGHYAHYDILGNSPFTRASVQGVNLNSIQSYGENLGVGQGSVRQGFDYTHNQMISEPAGQQNHRSTLLSNSYIGIGFAVVGDFVFLDEEFTAANPATSPISNTVGNLPVQGALGGPAGIPGGSVGGTSLVPTSIVTTGPRANSGLPDAAVNLTAGNTINVAGLINANGIAGRPFYPELPYNNFGEQGGKGANITINATHNITLFGLQSSGGQGAASGYYASSGTGGAGGTVSVTSSLGDITILPGSPCSACIGIGAVGGAGGQALGTVQQAANGPGIAGGTGGAGGAVALSAPSGAITVNSIFAGGGGGSGGNGGSTGGAGGAGGAGGSVALNSGLALTITQVIDASGGGGGGGGGSSSSSDGGGGGGGGSLGWAGSGGSGGSLYTGGGGAGFGSIPGAGGGSNPLTGPSPLNGANGSPNGGVTAQGGASGSPVFGNAGNGGQGSAGGTAGGTGGALAAAGSATSSASGGTAGGGGHISLTGQSVSVQSNFNTFFGTTANSGTNSLLALGTGGTVSISAQAVAQTISPLFSSNADYTSTVKSVPLSLGSYIVGSGASSGLNQTFGGIAAGPQPNSISIVGTTTNSPLLTQTFGTGSLTIIENGQSKVFTNGDLVTPAEFVALIQVGTSQLAPPNNQPLVLNALGQATGGALTITATNIPQSGFTTLVLPTGVTLNDQVNNLAFATSMTIAGTLAINNPSGVPTLTTPSLTLTGTITAAGNTLLVQGSGNVTALSVSIDTNSATLPASTTFSATLLNLTGLNGCSLGSAGAPINTIAGTVSTNTTGSGSVFLNNVSPANFSVLNIGQSLVGGNLNVVSNTGLSVIGPITAGGSVSLIAATNFGITVAANINADTFAPQTSGNGSITQLDNTSITDNTLALTAGTGTVTIGTATGSSAAVSNVLVNSSGTVTLQSTVPITMQSSSVAGALNLISNSGITISGPVSVGTGSFTTGSFTNLSTLTASGPSGTIQIQSPTTPLLDLLISGGGTLSAPGGITISSQGSGVRFTGNQTLNGNSTINANFGSLTIDQGVTLTLQSGILNINAGTVINSNGLLGPANSIVLNIPSGASIGTIVNSVGDVILTGSLLINTSGKSLILLAAGNISATGAPVINLSSTTSGGGSLIALAGFNIAPGTPSGQILDKTTLFTVTGPSLTGGSINLSSASINTSSAGTSTGSSGGRIIMAANAGTSNLGTINVRSINTSSVNRTGGAVTLLGAGGIYVDGSITSTGKLGGGSIMMAATPAAATGTILVQNGFMAAGALFAPGAVVSGSGAAVTVTGALSSGASNGTGGAITAISDAAILIGNGGTAVSSGGLTGSGNISIQSLNGTILVNGTVNSASLSRTDSSGTAGAAGGNVALQAPQFISVVGNIITGGGSNSAGSGNGGAGGNLTVSTSSSDNALGLFTGNVLISGYVDTRGGSARTAAGGGRAGDGGGVSITAGAMQINGMVSAGNGRIASIVTSAGSGNSSGIAGNVALSTYSVQSLPTNFDMLSTKATEYALPGAMLSFTSIGPAVNGPAFGIVSGTDIASAATAPVIGNNSAPVVFTIGSKISVTVTGGNKTIVEASGIKTIAPNSGANRVKITPAEAVAVSTMALTNQQTIGLNSSGQLISINPASSVSYVTLPQQFDLPQNFSSFVLAAADNASAVSLNVPGTFPVLNLNSASTRNISGTINFTSAATATITAGYLPLTVNAGASITSTGDLAMQTLNLANNGSINATGRIILLNAGGAIILTNAGNIVGTSLTLPSNAMPSFLSLTNNQGNFVLPIAFSNVVLPTTLGLTSVSLAPNNAPTPASTLIFSIAGPGATPSSASFTGSLNIPNLTIISQLNGQAKTNTGLVFTAGSSIYATQSLTIISSGAITSGADVSLGSGSGLTMLSSNGGISLGSHNTLSAPANIMISASNGPLSMGAPGALPTAITSANGAITLMANQNTLSLTQVQANSNSLLVSGFGGLNVLNNSQITAKYSLTALSSAGSITDQNTNSYSVTAGSALFSAKGISIGGGSNLSAAASLIMIGSSSPISLGSAGLQSVMSAQNLTIIGGSGGINTSQTQLSSVNGMTIIAGNGSFTDQGASSFTFGQPLTLIGNSVQVGPGSTISSNIRSVNIFATSGAIVLGAAAGASFAISGSTISMIANGPITTNNGTVTAVSGSLSMSANGTAMLLTAVNSAFTANGANVSQTAGSIAHSGTTTISAASGISLSAASGSVSLGQAYTTGGGTVSITGKTGVALNSALVAAGTTNGQPLPSAQLPNSYVIKPGTILISGGTTTTPGGISAGMGTTLISYGGDTKLTATGVLSLGNSGIFRALGGNLLLLSTANVSGGTANTFEARSIGSSAPGTSSGGGIELSAGSTSSQLSTAQAAASGQVKNTATLGTTVTVSDGANHSGVLSVNLKNAGTVNLSNINSTQLNFNGGAIVFDANGASINLDGASFTVDAYRPIAYSYAVLPATELWTSRSTTGNKHRESHLANILVPNRQGVQVLYAEPDHIGAGKPLQHSDITLASGQIFLNPLQDTTVHTPLADIKAKKGALVNLCLEGSTVRISACSGPGDITVNAAGRSLELAPGEELVLAVAQDHEYWRKHDGIGRRGMHHLQLSASVHATSCEFSIATMLGNLPHLRGLIDRKGQQERTICGRLMKMSAALQQVTAARGAYQALPASAPQESSPLRPVSW